MRTWTAHTTTEAAPEDVLHVLTDPDACRRWAPVPFEVEDEDGRLRSGTRARVRGRLAGVQVDFDVDVHRADEQGLALSAKGPVRFDVAYELAPAEGGSEVRASVSVRPGRGVLGVVMAEATAGLLRAGALQSAMARLAREASVACAPAAA